MTEFAVEGRVWPLQHPVLTTIGWAVAVVFAPLAVGRYRRLGR